MRVAWFLLLLALAGCADDAGPGESVDASDTGPSPVSTPPDPATSPGGASSGSGTSPAGTSSGSNASAEPVRVEPVRYEGGTPARLCFQATCHHQGGEGWLHDTGVDGAPLRLVGNLSYDTDPSLVPIRLTVMVGEEGVSTGITGPSPTAIDLNLTELPPGEVTIRVLSSRTAAHCALIYCVTVQAGQAVAFAFDGHLTWMRAP